MRFESRLPDVEKVCPICSGTFKRNRSKESLERFQGRVTCSKRCADEKRAGECPTEKRCVLCSRKFVRRKKEPRYHFVKRSTCAAQCAHIWRLIQRGLTPPPVASKVLQARIDGKIRIRDGRVRPRPPTKRRKVVEAAPQSRLPAGWNAGNPIPNEEWHPWRR